MTDINEWTLTYPNAGGAAVTLNFGLSTNSDFPFSTQVSIEDADRTNSDVQHGTDDAILMGRDLLGGMNLNFSLTTLPEDTDKINAALDAASLFAARWRAFSISHTPRAFAILKNNYRQRMVFGRPRNFTPKHDRLRKGIIEYVAQFRTITPEFYGVTENSVDPVRNVSLPVDIHGEVPAFPIITFTGPFSTASLKWTPGSLLQPWTLTLDHALTAGDQVMIDTRPFIRSVTNLDNNPKNGWLSGARMSDCSLNPDAPSGAFLFTTTGTTTGSTHCTVEWFDTYAGL